MNNKKYIVISICIILIFCIITFLMRKNNKEYIMQDGVMLAFTLDGEKISYVPEKGKYKINVKCNNADGIWLQDEWKLAIENIIGAVTCNIDFTSNPSTLISEVESKSNHYTFIDADYSQALPLTQSEYGTPNIFSSTSITSTSGTSETNIYSFSENSWNSNKTNLISGTYYHFQFSIPTEDYYQLCYSVSSGNENNRIYAYVNNNKLYFGNEMQISASTTSETTDCIYIGKLSTADSLKIIQRPYSSSSGSISTLNFYIKKTSKEKTYDVGYRYSGTNPNNYVWFNNEMWRIIGSVPTCTSSGCETSEKMVKLIRSESLGSLVYDAKSSGYTGAWGSNTLYTLLNNYYYGALDGTGTNYCYGSYNSNNHANSSCNYSINGINPNTYYGKMVKNVYWNTGIAYRNASNVKDIALNEIKNQTVSGFISLINLSDYWYASSSNYHTQRITSDKTNWLYGQHREWTSAQYSRFTVNYLDNRDGVYYESTGYGNIVRPVIHLDSDVYVVSGDGSITNPYQIGI